MHMKLNSLFQSVQSNNTAYRPDIDGLRAIAVLLVVLFHAFPNRLSGGFIGVDIFFVISGYLISSIILKEISKNDFTILGFYKKRINRIYPALAFVLLVSIFVSRYMLFKAELAEFDFSLFFSTIFSANLYFLNTLNYFDNSAENHPLLHLWSLGVEEQFYIFWPLLLWYVAKKTLSFGFKIIGVVLVASFLLNVYFVAQYQSNVFYLPFTRFWELGFGSLCAFITRSNTYKPPLKILSLNVNSDFLTICGLSLIVVCELIITPTSLFPGWYALLPVIGSGLILVYGQTSNFAKRFLANRVLVFIGLISYPLYLWHWPILSFGHIYLGYLMVGFVKVFLVLMSFLLAIMTYYLIEIPLRYRINHKLKPTVLFTLLLLIGLFGLLNRQNILSSSLTEQDDFVSFYKGYVGHTDYVNKNRVYCSFIDPSGSFERNIPENCILEEQKNLIVLWGDSHAYQLFSGLNQHLDHQYHLSQLTSSGCHPFLPDNVNSGSINCNKANSQSLDVIKKTKPNIVLLAQKDSHDLTDWETVAAELHKLGVKKVILLGPVPQWNQYLYRYLAKNYHNLSDIPSHVGGGVLNQDMIALDRKMKNKYSHSNSLKYVSLIDLFCEPKLGCLTFVKDSHELTTFDYGHLSLSASNLVAIKLADAINN